MKAGLWWAEVCEGMEPGAGGTRELRGDEGWAMAGHGATALEEPGSVRRWSLGLREPGAVRGRRLGLWRATGPGS